MKVITSATTMTTTTRTMTDGDALPEREARHCRSARLQRDNRDGIFRREHTEFGIRCDGWPNRYER